jgi:hypothetical protein
MSYVDLIESEINASSDDPAYAGGASDTMIAEFEKKLGVSFPTSYRLFLKKFGALSFAGDTYYGITKSGLGATSVPSVLFATQDARSLGDADENMIVIKSSGYGPMYSIDTSIIGETGEPAVVLTELSFKRDGEKLVVYQCFEDFFCDSIRQSINEL